MALAIIGGDQQIESATIKLIIRCFSQRSELRKNLHEVYLLYGEQGLESYKKFAKLIKEIESLKRKLKDIPTSGLELAWGSKELLSLKFLLNSFYKEPPNPNELASEIDKEV